MVQEQTSPLPLVYKKVMTKQGDNEPKLTAPPPHRVDDAFAKYSDDGVRLKKILLKDDAFDLQDFANRHYTTAEKMNLRSANINNTSNPQDRKTRISFEAHPSLIIDDDMLETLQYDCSIDLQDEDDVDLFAYFDILQ